MRDSFGTGRFVIGVIEVLGWLTFAAGLFAAGNVVLSPRPEVGGLILAAALVGAGLLQVAVVQIARAQIATAENTAELVRLISARAAPQRSEPPVSTLGSGRGEVVAHRRGKTILRDGAAFVVDDRSFGSLAEAERWIDGR